MTVGRINAIDGLRGLCLLFMTITHMEFGHEFLLGYAHFKYLGFADSAQAFIFLSGLLVGLVGMRQYLRGGYAPVARRYRRRTLELYCWYLGLLLVILVASRLLPDAWSAWGDWLQHLFEDGQAYAVASATVIYQPVFLDILPQYMLYLLAAPLLIRLAPTGVRGRRSRVPCSSGSSPRPAFTCRPSPASSGRSSSAARTSCCGATSTRSAGSWPSTRTAPRRRRRAGAPARRQAVPARRPHPAAAGLRRAARPHGLAPRLDGRLPRRGDGGADRGARAQA
jgi:hypothetical protein